MLTLGTACDNDAQMIAHFKIKKKSFFKEKNGFEILGAVPHFKSIFRKNSRLREKIV